MVALMLSCYLVFGPSSPGTRHYPLMFVVLPVLLWVALRFGDEHVGQLHVKTPGSMRLSAQC